ncbi:MAG TPA: MBOAT family protein [Candidatus Sulfopaludibacter sp.]|nr:MBOAT family protein [Candidatus Sulfopaludibacter sp.]
MLFSSYTFLFFFLPTTLTGFCLLSRYQGPKAAKIWLVLASLFFYGWWNPVYVALILASMGFNYVMGRQIGRRVASGSSANGALFLGVAVNLAVLGYFKYASFFLNNINEALGSHWTLGRIILPLGISFFTFTQIAYLVDASRGVVCEYDLGDFLLFVTFFPHLIAGPIIHHSEMMPQFAESRTYHFDWNNLAAGLGLFSLGLFKKVVIADGMSGYAGKVFGAAASGGVLHPQDAWAGVLAYTFQIYFDFSGYSDMAIALARMFGIVLPQNFNSPYKAVNVSDFWRRWHMTLSRFLRDYLYIPLGGNRRGEFRRYVNLVVTMTLGGLWHGAAWTFVLWGLFHGAGLAIQHGWQTFWSKNRLDRPAWWPTGLSIWSGRASTLLFVMVGWVLFRSADLATAQHVLAAMFGFGRVPIEGSPLLVKVKTWWWFGALLAFVWWLPNTVEIMGRHTRLPTSTGNIPSAPQGWLRWEMSSRWACLAGLLLAVSILSLSRAGEFLYYNF